MRCRLPPPCGGALEFNGQPPFFLLFCDQKRSRKVPLLPRRGARLRGYSPLRTPRRRSSAKKAKKRRSAALFLTLFRPSPFYPFGAKIDSMGVELKAPLCKGGSREAGGGLWPYPKIELPRKTTIPPPLRGTSLYTREALRGDASIAPYTQPCGGCRGEHCSPAGSCVVAKLPGRTVFTPTRV